MFPFGKSKKEKPKKRKLTHAQAMEENEDTFEKLMEVLGYRKNGDGPDNKPEWIGEPDCFFNGDQTINEEDER